MKHSPKSLRQRQRQSEEEEEASEEEASEEEAKPRKQQQRSVDGRSKKRSRESSEPATQGQIAALQGQLTALLNAIQPGVDQHLGGHPHPESQHSAGYPGAEHHAVFPVFLQPQLPMFQTPSQVPFVFHQPSF